jgi:hypothetical protein
MNIGDIVIWGDRRFRLLGFSRKSLPQTEAQLEDLETGEWTSVPVEELTPADDEPPRE